MTINAFEVRRQNLRQYISKKFDGNRSAFSRAVGTNPNQINLVLADGAHRRNLGEDLARRMEHSLHLPDGYFDQRNLIGTDTTHKVSGLAIPVEAAAILRKADMVEHAAFYNSYLDTISGKITARENLVLARIATREMEPEIGFDEHVVVDMGVKAVSGDGVYLIGKGSDLFLRRITKQMAGGWLIHAPTREPVVVDTLKGLKAAGKIVMLWRHITL